MRAFFLQAAVLAVMVISSCSSQRFAATDTVTNNSSSSASNLNTPVSAAEENPVVIKHAERIEGKSANVSLPAK